MFVTVPAPAERAHHDPHKPDKCGLVDPSGIEPEERVERRGLGEDDDAG